MWVSLQVDNYLIKYGDENAKKAFFLTNMIRIWKCSFTQDVLIVNFKEANKALQWPDNITAINCIVNLFCKNSPSIKRRVLTQGDEATVFASSSISGYPYKMELSFQQMTPEVLYEEFTYVLLATINSFYKREKRLVEIIKSKDVELEEYRQEGFEIKRRGVITAPFHFEAFDKDSMETASKEVLENPVSIFRDSVLFMLPQLQKPFFMEESEKIDPSITVSKAVEENESSVNLSDSCDDTQGKEKAEPTVPRKKKKTSGILSL